MTNDLMIQVDDKAVFEALKIVYKGASDKGLALVMSYCKARKIDPLLKPVHIVKMKSKIGERWVDEDTIMPGIGLYRIQASRSGCMGISQPAFGDIVHERVGSIELRYPLSATVAVKKLMPNGLIAEFQATEFWLENYANKGAKYEGGKKVGIDASPNDMWAKRPFGQLAKCAEAQALRKAFPEVVDNLPTFEEKAQQEVIIRKDFHKETPINPSEKFYADTINLDKALDVLNMCQDIPDLKKAYEEIIDIPALKMFKAQLADAKDIRKDFLSSVFKENQESTAPGSARAKVEVEDDEWVKAFDGETGEIKDA